MLRKIVDLYIESSLHVALAVAALVAVTGEYFDFDVPPYVLGALFFGSVVGYNFIKYAPLASDFLSVKGSYYKGMQVFSLFNFCVALYFLKDFSPVAIALAFLAGGLVFFYVYPVHKLKVAIRNVRGVKVYVVALVWALCTVILPVVESGDTFGFSVFLEVIRRMLFVLAITIPFEIRDLNLDQPGLFTIPQQLGVRGAKLLGYCFLLLFWLLGVVFDQGYLQDKWQPEGILVMLSLVLLYGAGRDRHRYYTGLIVESLPLVWLGLLKFF